ncbi:glycosyltransferase family 2 protein [uncultured Desulfosarcina sp.]|uniref:glycosyltransferase family 2 protein n=1 Tax=uncultured Desulfosarcina sp. TaxID=218289 RepID=UPI0029C616D2|nr:glycosyltransferase family 2 protein [uncultured Desulfosarcina sp.]
MPNNPELSVAIITFNEADRLPVCVESVRFADEIVVVDSGSRDGTRDIARSLGCSVCEHPFAGFARQKQFAVDQCRHDWVLILDADERLPKSTADDIKRQLTHAGDDVAAFRLQRRNYLHGRWIRHCGWWPDTVVRLVRPHKGAFSDSRVHERWIAEGPIVELAGCIDHYSFRDYADMIEKLQHYSSLAAQEMMGRKTRVNCCSPLLHGGWTFFSVYVLKLGFIYGLDGLIISLLNAGGSFMKYAKYWEMTHYPTVTDTVRRK